MSICMRKTRFVFIVFVVLTSEVILSQESHRARPEIPNQSALEALPKDGGTNWNRLVFEQSPYLLQHAANPVDWFPWGDAAFEKARQENKPIFLSIGYATCHWCHVMEHESFEDEEVAALINAHFVAIKVDREERPDIDSIYMAACQAATGSGGWPLTAILDHQKQPFFVGTYFPKHGVQGRPGMMDLIPKIADLWENQRDDIYQAATRLTEHLKTMSLIQPGQAPTRSLVEQAVSQLSDRYDAQHGGFGQAPKFPTPHNLMLLLRHWYSSKDANTLKMVTHTLKSMRAGGVYDHIGFGLHRYSTDRHWLLPHFEKMLYDQALLVMACAETFQITSDEAFKETASEVVTYVLRDLTSSEGGFYSAEDADSEGEEGKFYVWTPDQVRQLLGDKDADWFNRHFQIVAGGNFVEQSKGIKTGESIPHLRQSWVEIAKADDKDIKLVKQRYEKIRQKLFDHREKRIHPFKDDKILTDWNGLMIAALAKSGRAFGNSDHIEASAKAAAFVWSQLSRDGKLLKRTRNGKAGLQAHLEDYAFYIWGLIELYEATGDEQYLARAIDLSALVQKEFADIERGGFFQTAHHSETLIIRQKDIYDGAIPSGNSVMALNLLRLSKMTGNQDYDKQAQSIFTAFSKSLHQYPSGHSFLLMALDFATTSTSEVVIAMGKSEQKNGAMLKALNARFMPHTVILQRTGDDDPITKLAPFTALQKAVDQRDTAYVCRNFACQAPTNDIDVMIKAIEPQAK